jgi:HEAT repeat protein
MARYLNELLTTGKIDKALKLVRSDPAMVKALLSLFSDPDTVLNTRIGISAIMEHLEGSGLINGMIDHLGKLTGHQDARIRGDACHYLGLTGNRDAIDYIKPLLDDNDDDVRELAQESMKLLSS